MRSTKTFNDLVSQVQFELTQRVLPFWLENGPDEKYGGFFTCFDPITAAQTRDLKFMWAQGRMLWALSELTDWAQSPAGSEAMQDSPVTPDDFPRQAEQLFHFLDRYSTAENGRAYHLLSRDGAPLTLLQAGLDDNDELHPSTFADCFLAMAFARFASVFGHRGANDRSEELFRSIRDLLSGGRFRTHPYPSPPGTRSHGEFLISSLAAGEAIRGENPPPTAKEILRGSLARLRQDFRSPDGLFRELSPPPAASQLGRYANPGHTLETYGVLLDNRQAARDVGWSVDEILDGIERTVEQSWDETFGGLFAFLLRGTTPGEDPWEHHTLNRTVQRDWSLKLWWPHVEAMYTCFAAALTSGRQSLREWYETIHRYTMQTFPSGGKSEWIQIRSREGIPVRRVTGLPVKDGYHITRSLLKILQTASRQDP